jgi:hypothetical protein
MTKFTDKIRSRPRPPGKGQQGHLREVGQCRCREGVRGPDHRGRRAVLRAALRLRQPGVPLHDRSLPLVSARGSPPGSKAAEGNHRPRSDAPDGRARRRSGARPKQSLEAETFGEAVDDYIIREQIGRRKNATANQVKRGLTTDCAAWKNRPVADIKAADIRRAAGDHPRRRQGHAASTLPREPDLRLPEDLLRLVRGAGHREDPALAHDRPEAPVGGRGSPPAVVHGRRAEGALDSR